MPFSCLLHAPGEVNSPLWGGGLGRCAVTSNCESECNAMQQSKTTAPFNYLECAIVELQKRINNNCVIFGRRGNGSLCLRRFLVWVFVRM